MAQLLPPEPRLAAVAVSGWSDLFGASPLPWWGERLRVGVVMRSSPPVERRRSPPVPEGSGGPPAPVGLQAQEGRQKHRRYGDVLTSPSELWGIVPPIHDVALDLAGATLGAASWVTRAGRIMVRRARWLRRWLVLPPLS